MTTIERQCRRDGCTETVSYGVESRHTPKYCSFECRDRVEIDGEPEGFDRSARRVHTI